MSPRNELVSKSSRNLCGKSRYFKAMGVLFAIPSCVFNFTERVTHGMVNKLKIMLYKY